VSDAETMACLFRLRNYGPQSRCLHMYEGPDERLRVVYGSEAGTVHQWALGPARCITLRSALKR
jgi:hypothetical protein